MFYKCLVSSGSPVSLIKWLHCGPFSGKIPTISKHSKETFFLESVFADARNCGLQAYGVRKKGTNLQRLFWNLQTVTTFFSVWELSEIYL